MTSDVDRIGRAKLLYERALFGGDGEALDLADRELDAVEADLALARGRLLHTRFLLYGRRNPRELSLFEQAVARYAKLGDRQGEAEALFWAGACQQVVLDDELAALPMFEGAYELAIAVGDKLTASYAVRHLGFADQAAGRMTAARERFEEAVRLRREIGFLPGVAAGLLTLAQWAAVAGDRDQALALFAEATSIAEASGARGVLSWIEAARAEL